MEALGGLDDPVVERPGLVEAEDRLGEFGSEASRELVLAQEGKLAVGGAALGVLRLQSGDVAEGVVVARPALHLQERRLRQSALVLPGSGVFGKEGDDRYAGALRPGALGAVVVEVLADVHIRRRALLLLLLEVPFQVKAGDLLLVAAQEVRVAVVSLLLALARE